MPGPDASAHVSELIEIKDAGGEARRVAMTGDVMTFGSSAEASVRCTGAGIEPLHVRLVRAGDHVRVEPVRHGATVDVNGEPLFCKDLEPGDEIEFGGCMLRWIVKRGATPAAGRHAPAPRAPVRTPAPRAKAPAAPAPRTRTARSRGTPAWMMVSGVVVLVLAGIVLALQAFAKSSWPHTPQDYVDLAREQLANSQPQRALDTLDVALAHAEGGTRDQALKLQADIRRLLVERTEVPKVQTARREQELLASYEARYLQGAAERPAAREFVRLCDAWLAQHGDLCRRIAEGNSLVQFVEQVRTRYVTAAALGEPDTAADVIFAAQSKLRFQWRDYRSAVARLDAFLAQHADEAVQAERARMIADGEQWLQGKLKFLDQLIARGDRDNAERDLQQIEQWSMLPEWEPMVKERRAKL